MRAGLGLDDACERLFRSAFDGAPSVVASAPGRANLIGDHTDYNDGFVLPFAIDRRTHVALRVDEGGGPSRAVSGVDPGEVQEFMAGADDGAVGSWAKYVQGVVALLGRRVGRAVRVDVAVSSDVPLGMGLSSSAAIEVAVATALAHALGAGMDALEIALLCQRAEHEYAGVPCGIMDQLISADATAGHALLIDCRSRERERVRVTGGGGSDGSAVVLIDSGIRHDLSDGGYAARRRECESAAHAVASVRSGVASLRDARLEDLAAIDAGEEVVRRARHVVTENERVLRVRELLRADDRAGVGEALVESHASLRDDFETSHPDMDALIRLLCARGGVYGARMTGGGFGGAAVALVEASEARSAIEEVVRAYRDETGREATGFVTSASRGAAVS